MPSKELGADFLRMMCATKRLIEKGTKREHILWREATEREKTEERLGGWARVSKLLAGRTSRRKGKSLEFYKRV